MKHETHTLIQGTSEWAAHRATHFNASDAAAMLGLSPYKSRNKLLAEKSSGIAEEVDEATQRRFDAGHENEATARPWAEEIIGEELYPVVVSADISGMPLSASLDGATMAETINFEHKTLNQALAAALDAGTIPGEYKPQMEQGLLISGAEKCLFMASNGIRETMRFAWYESDPAVRKQLLAGWVQFLEDSQNYKPIEVIPAAVAAPTMQLPALSIQVTGSIALTDNLKLFGERLGQFIEGLPQKPSTDQEFADAEAAIKTLGTAETALEAAKSSALAQTASIDEMTRTVALYAGQARTTRLMLEKLVKARKETIRVEIVQGGKDALATHVAGLNKRLGKAYITADTIPAYFANVIKGKKSIASLRDAVDTEIARVKIEANAIADRVGLNLNTLRELSAGCEFLFADAGHILFKENDDFTALVKMRIGDHKVAEQKRLDGEREKIRAEEQAKAETDQRRKADNERLRLMAIQEEDEEKAKAKEHAAPDASFISGAPTPPVAPAAAAPKPTGAMPTMRPDLAAETGGSGSPGTIPTAEAIVNAVANSFGVSDEIAYGWIIEAFSNQARRVA